MSTRVKVAIATVSAGLCLVLAAGIFARRNAGMMRLRLSSNGRVQRRSDSVLGAVHGRELIMVVVGAAGCAASQESKLAQSIAVISESLSAIATRQHVLFSSVGVALDPDAAQGVRWLNEAGRFDEVSAGNRWLNTGAIEYLWRDPLAVGLTPQVIIALRHISREPHYRWKVSGHHVLVRMVGLQDVLGMAGLNQVDSLVAAARSTDQIGNKQ
jgi:hypothetical protein